ncbi:hypothetical protein OHA25_29590 [Nonomuraea sp. NBC_00507]|uniref:hypothetical protein n=1 Tax=Nonomuraea sp. NBC_00507 TaxID=2976002 RepID=UPI002E19D00B
MPTISRIAAVTTVTAGVVISTAAVSPAHAEATATPAFVAYHAASAGRQTTYARTLKKQGYHPITVNVSAGGRYAAVWVKGSSPAWAIYQGMSGPGYQSRFNEFAKKGYQPISVSATGSGSGAVFAAVFEKKSGKHFARHGLTARQFASVNQKAASTGYTLSSVDVYGSAASPRYVGVWTANTGGGWYYTYGKTAKQHEAEVAKRLRQGFRPTQVAVGPDGTYAAVWRKDGLRSWAHYIEMSSSGYQKRFDQQRARGLYPVQVNSESGRYAAVFVKT